MKKIFNILFFLLIANYGFGQEVPVELQAIGQDDAEQLSTLITNNNINACYLEKYTLLAETIRLNANNCFQLLIEKGADLNKVCGDYFPPIMFAAKYGRLEMLKTLLAKGANKNYHYHGSLKQFEGETPLSYAEKNKQTAVVDYLRSLTK
ncbi:ankyrin repeat domain-containing protein [Mucilaginibacter sp. AK015]|uniref:ankyrin repeat domain-containing protein n=1 Tax=Mucilaginibacter sp. AK015 TaxID=2723072 RepID=UPI0016079424|nr:ankyrin repeat domain-containing protein [Mucilaginibacter sp. AK015]MBB5396677.1 ankyrin repeat protein [Mucilaginibacter sp. AK015]